MRISKPKEQTKKLLNKRLTNDLVTQGRSQGEELIIALLRLSFPGLKIVRNDKSVLGRQEIDIHIPTHKIAIEVQGITHYREIYGAQRFIESQERDARKKKNLEELGFTLIEINISNFTKENLYQELKKYANAVLIPQIKIIIQSQTLP